MQRVAEKCWLGDLGQDAIHIDPDAMRAVKVFEDGDVDNGEEDDTATQHDTKRSRFRTRVLIILLDTEDGILKAAIAKYGKNQWYILHSLIMSIFTN